MPARHNPRDPWRRAPVGELSEQLLPRWFVLLAVVLVPVAIAAVIGAFVVFGPATVPIAERRPPPAGGLSSDVGDHEVGDRAAEPYAAACPLALGIQVAGAEADRSALRSGIAGLCNTTLPAEVGAAVRAFSEAGGIVRFAQFEATGVDSAARLDTDPPVILVNAKLQQTDPLWIAPAVAHDAVVLAGDPGSVETALAARRAEDIVCVRLLEGRRPSRGCEDAAALLALPDPAAALREAGFR